jgi:hypothetical protein
VPAGGRALLVKRGMDAFGQAALSLLAGGIGGWLAQVVHHPGNALRALRTDIAAALTSYSDLYSNPTAVNGRENEAKKTFRELAAKLAAYQHNLPLFGLTRHLYGLPSAASMTEASHKLILLSNYRSYGAPRAIEDAESAARAIVLRYEAQEVRTLLGIPLPPELPKVPQERKDWFSRPEARE